MSLFRPRFLDDIVKPLASASTKLRGLKGFDPQQVAAFQDPLYAEDPLFWSLTGFLLAAPGFTGHLGVQTPNDPNLVVTVDTLMVGSDVVNEMTVMSVQGGTVLLNLVTDSQVTRRNRKERQDTAGAVERVGLLRIADNTNAFNGTELARGRVPASGEVIFPLGHRLYGSEQLFVSGAVNTYINATLYGRYSVKGQR